MRKKIAALCLLLLLCGCAQQETQVPTAPATVPDTASAEPMVTMPPAVASEAAALVEAPPPPSGVVLEAEASAEKEERCDDAVVDYSHTEDGYIMARYLGQTEKKLKIRVFGPTTTYTYNLPAGQWTVFPLSDGNGTYKAAVYINTHDSKYALVMSAEFEVELKDEFAPFLRPNQYVDYSCAPGTVEKGALLCAGLEHPLEKVAAVYDFVVGTFSYDYDRAATVKSGYLPVLDDVLVEEKGICFDYAAVMAAMLRSQEVPCKLVVGYAGDTYHAWISVWTEENGWIDGAIFFDGHMWKRMDPTFASSGQRSDEIMDFIEHGSYTAKYLY
ncbi:MAG: transglutaminase domain-containing protein [Oscillospiraceae bacterium]|nr:transglutaminase domain-containing protein [Oscillospiraceae bacterium]